jgi:hypothetical protein
VTLAMLPVSENVEREREGSTNKKKQDALTYLMISCRKEKYSQKIPEAYKISQLFHVPYF